MNQFDDIRAWAAARNLIDGSSAPAQMLKLLEEAGELAAAIAKRRPVDAKDAIGDVVVVLTILSAQLGFPLEDAIAAAYEEIKDRKGRMVDGIFLKEADELLDTLPPAA